MIRLIKLLLLVGLLVGLATDVEAFSLRGKIKSWQTQALGYGFSDDPDAGPMGLFEDYRWNITNIYYAMDQSFLNYFGTRGMAEADKAFALMNGVPPVSQMSTNLTEFPQTDMLRANYRAGALRLWDVKSMIFAMMARQIGLADPIRYNWVLRGRATYTVAGVTYTNWSVIKLNFDPVSWQSSSYVNGALWGYNIEWDVLPLPRHEDALEVLADTVPQSNGNPLPVAGSFGYIYTRDGSYGLLPGEFWMGWTRDDVGGIRHLYRSSNFNVETILPGSELAVTNRSAPVLLTNDNLALFIERTSHTTNSVTNLLSFYPNLQITSTNAFLEAALQTNVFFYFTNAPLPGYLRVSVTNRTTNFVTFYDYSFGNVTTNLANGTITITPPNLLGYEVITNILTNAISVTNLALEFGFYLDTNNPVPLSTSNLALFNEIARTNPPAVLQTYYPGLVVSSSYYVITNGAFTNVSWFFTNSPFAPAGSTQMVVFETVTNVLVTNYYHTFANMVTNILFTNTLVTRQQVVLDRNPFAPAGVFLFRSNTVSTTYLTNVVSGNFYLVPTNLAGYQMIAVLLTNEVPLTNVLYPRYYGTNAGSTNVVTPSPLGTNVFSTTFITNFLSLTNIYLLTPGTNYTFSVYPVYRLFGGANVGGTNPPAFTSTNPLVVRQFTNVYSTVYPIQFQGSSNSVGIRPGVEKLHFINVTTNFDSLIGQFFLTITNQYVEHVITNSQLNQQVVRRVLGAPDILLVSGDLGLVDEVPVLSRESGTTNWVNNDGLNGSTTQGGPGVITPSVVLAFSDQVPYFINRTPYYLDDRTAFGGYMWGSFDGTTNTPVVYPDRYSIEDLESWILNPPP